jgi:hypothetical protein
VKFHSFTEASYLRLSFEPSKSESRLVSLREFRTSDLKASISTSLPKESSSSVANCSQFLESARKNAFSCVVLAVIANSAQRNARWRHSLASATITPPSHRREHDWSLSHRRLIKDRTGDGLVCGQLKFLASHFAARRASAVRHFCGPGKARSYPFKILYLFVPSVRCLAYFIGDLKVLGSLKLVNRRRRTCPVSTRDQPATRKNNHDHQRFRSPNSRTPYEPSSHSRSPKFMSATLSSKLPKRH